MPRAGFGNMNPMNQAPEFDLFAAIKKLAESEWECQGDGVIPPPSYGIIHAQAHCTRCDDTGRIVPFAALRVPCRVIPHTDKFLHDAIGDWCEGRGWIPEPDVEKACWKVLKVLADNIDNDGEAALHLIDNMEEEAVLRAALAWLEEQRVHFQSM